MFGGPELRIVDTIEKNNTDDKVEYDITSLEPVMRKHLSHLELFKILWCSSKREHRRSWMQ